MSFVNRTRWIPVVALALWVAIAPQHAVAAKADDYVAEAREFIAEGELKAAVIELKNALQADPSHVEARLQLGALYLRSSDGAAAAKEFRRARDLGAPKKDWMPGYARGVTLQGEFRKVLDDVVVSDELPGETQAMLLALRGNAQLALRQIDAANNEYDAALAIESANPMARLGKAQILLLENRREDALTQLNQVLAAYPDHVESLLVRGDLLRSLQRIDDAEKDYKVAATAMPSNPRAFIGLALTHIAQRDIKSAKKDLEALNRLTKDVPAVHYLQALVAFQERGFDRASDELQAVLRVAPTNLQAQMLYGIVSYARNQFTIADDYLTRVLASTPDNLQIIKLVGASRLKLHQADRAVDVLSRAVDDSTEDAQLLALLGTAYLQSGDNSKGAEYIERAVKIDPEQALLRTQLAVGKIATGDTSGAISQLESAVALGQDVVQADVLLVLSYLNKREYDKAVTASEALEKRMADSPIPYNLTGLAFLAQKKFEPARERFETALKKDPAFLVAQMNLARLALVAKQPAEAKEAYEAVLEKDPKHVGAILGLAAIATTAGERVEATSLLLRANRADPRALKPILILAENYLRSNEGLKAINVLSGLSPEQSDLPTALRLKGMAQLQSGEFLSAVATLDKLAKAAPESIESWFQLARAQAAADDADASRRSFERAIELDTSNRVPIVWVGLGELELREKRYDAALALAEKIKKNFPAYVFGFDIASAAHRGNGNIEASLKEAETALSIEQSPERVDAFSRALTAAGQADRAEVLLNKWLQSNPEDGARWAQLGLVRQQLGKDDAAIEAYEKALQTEKPDAVLANNMAWLYLNRDGERATELATMAYEMAPTRAEIVDTYGWVLFRNGRKNEGLAALQQAMIIAPRNPEIALHVAEALHEMRRSSEARPVLQRIVRDHPGTEYAKNAQALLARTRG